MEIAGSALQDMNGLIWQLVPGSSGGKGGWRREDRKGLRTMSCQWKGEREREEHSRLLGVTRSDAQGTVCLVMFRGPS